MDNFHFLNVKPSIDKKQTASIKDAIFKRAREKANALAEEKSENYTAQVQDDVMKLARDSFKQSQMNPFDKDLGLTLSQRFKKPSSVSNNTVSDTANNVAEIKAKEVIKETPSVKKTEQTEKTEQPQRVPKRNIESASNETYVKSVNKELMNDARNQFRQGTNLNTVLNFLNTQAAINMAKYAHSKINYA